MRAGFAEVEITPPVGTHKIGWILDVVFEEVRDPLYARAAVFESGSSGVGFVQLDTLSVRWSFVDALRRRIQDEYDFPGTHVMVAATHNHAGPAVANCGLVRRDGAYLDVLLEKCVEVFGTAYDAMREAEIGFGRVADFDVARNRRVVLRDGTVQTHGGFADARALCLEGPVDPEVAVVAARGKGGEWLGCLVNYACHPTHHGPDGVLSAGFPGELARVLKERDCPVTLFLNGACGNLHTMDPATGRDLALEQAGRRLADDASRALATMQFQDEVWLGAGRMTLQLRYRKVTPEEIGGTARGAQRLVGPEAYEAVMPGLLERIEARHMQPAEVQVLFVNGVAFAGLPGECFAEIGLGIKEQAHPRHAVVVGCANGMVGYVPTRHAFARGGYETTFGPWSRLAPEAGGMLAEAAVQIIRSKT